MLAQIEAELATAGLAKVRRLRQRADLIRETDRDSRIISLAVI